VFVASHQQCGIHAIKQHNQRTAGPRKPVRVNKNELGQSDNQSCILIALFLSEGDTLHFASRSPSSSRLRLLKEFEELRKILTLVSLAPIIFGSCSGLSETRHMPRMLHLHRPQRSHNQRIADFLVLLPVSPLANTGAVEDVSACFAAGKSKGRRFNGIAAEALHKHNLICVAW
jgi:hypothetical protein